MVSAAGPGGGTNTEKMLADFVTPYINSNTSKPLNTQISELQTNINSSIQSAGKGFQLFLANGTFTVPQGITTIFVTAIGGGGGGGGGDGGANNYSYFAGGGGGGGGSGNYVIHRPFNVTPGQKISITIGQGGHGGNAGTCVAIRSNYASSQYGSNGTQGTATIIGSLITLPGGTGGTTAAGSFQDMGTLPTGVVAMSGGVGGSGGAGGGGGGGPVNVYSSYNSTTAGRHAGSGQYGETGGWGGDSNAADGMPSTGGTPTQKILVGGSGGVGATKKVVFPSGVYSNYYLYSNGYSGQAKLLGNDVLSTGQAADGGSIYYASSYSGSVGGSGGGGGGGIVVHGNVPVAGAGGHGSNYAISSSSIDLSMYANGGSGGVGFGAGGGGGGGGPAANCTDSSGNAYNTAEKDAYGANGAAASTYTGGYYDSGGSGAPFLGAVTFPKLNDLVVNGPAGGGGGGGGCKGMALIEW